MRCRKKPESRRPLSLIAPRATRETASNRAASMIGGTAISTASASGFPKRRHPTRSSGSAACEWPHYPSVRCRGRGCSGRSDARRSIWRPRSDGGVASQSVGKRKKKSTIRIRSRKWTGNRARGQFIPTGFPSEIAGMAGLRIPDKTAASTPPEQTPPARRSWRCGARGHRRGAIPASAPTPPPRQ